MAIRKSSSSGIPFGNTAGRPANPSLGQPYFNGQVGRLELYSSNGWQNIVQETPGISSASGTYSKSTGSGTFTISGTNFVDGGIAYAVGTNATEYQATTTTYNSIVQMTALFTGLSPDYEPYDIKIINPSNLFGLLPDAFFINDSPVWSTTAGSLGAIQNGSVSIQLSATDDESNTITYSVTSGSLPTGLSLSSSGLISGTNSGTPGSTYTFTVSASDGTNTAVTRSFSIAIPYPVVTGGTLTSDSTYYYRTFTSSSNLVVSANTLTATALVIAGGGGGGALGGAGGAGGLRTLSSSLLPKTYSISVGAGGAGGSGGGGPTSAPANGVDSFISGTDFTTFTSTGGGYGGSYSVYPLKGGDGGSGGGSSYSVSDVFGLGNTPSTSPSQGNNGAPSRNDPYLGGGGGGAGGAAPAAAVSNAGTGGSASNSYSSWLTAISSSMSAVNGWSTATSTGYIAGGGGGSKHNTYGGNIGLGGGGGASDGTATANALPATSNTGSGGGGGGFNGGTFYSGGSGGSGIVIIRYTKASVGD